MRAHPERPLGRAPLGRTITASFQAERALGVILWIAFFALLLALSR